MPKTIWILIQPSLSLLSCQGCLNLIPYPVLVRGEGGAIWASTGGVHSSSTWLPACLLPATKYLRDLSLYFWTAQIEVSPPKTQTQRYFPMPLYTENWILYLPWSWSEGGSIRTSTAARLHPSTTGVVLRVQDFVANTLTESWNQIIKC